MSDRIVKTEQEWRDMLSPEEFEVTRRKGTERAFTGAYWDKKDAGMYRCRCCGDALFASNTKYDSGSGWPSFYEALDPAKVRFRDDYSFGMHRIEVTCARCDAHLGHVFPDGPKPTGQRYCINSCSLQFQPTSAPQAE